jgi:hypothetical protein
MYIGEAAFGFAGEKEKGGRRFVFLEKKERIIRQY